MSQVDVDTHRVKMKLTDRDNVETPWLDVGVDDAHDDWQSGLPAVGAQGACLLEDKAAEGLFLCCLYSKEDKPKEPKSVDVRQWVMKDGAKFRYDREAHELYVDVPDGGAINIKVGGTCTIEATGDVHVKPGGHLLVAGGSEYFARADKTDARFEAIENNLLSHVHPTGVGPSLVEAPPITPGESVACEKSKTD